MNICLLNRYFDFRGTGVTRIATEVTRELLRQGHTVQRYATSGDSLYSYAYQTAVLAPLRMPRRNVDVYHALATLEAMWLPRRKSIATILDMFTTTNPERAGAGMGYSHYKLMLGRWYFSFGSQLAARCRYIVCISYKTRQDILEHIKVDDKKISVIRLGISPSLIPQPSNNSHRLTIGTLSQLDKRKRLDLLIRQFRTSRIDADLLIAGKGPDRGLLQDIAGDDSRIHFLGMVPDGKLAEFYNSLDLFVFPTGIEGYGLPAVEAMACNKPVMVLSDSILPQEVKSHCIAVDNLNSVFNNQQDLSGLMKAVDYHNNLEFARLHSWSRCVNEYIELYKRIKED